MPKVQSISKSNFAWNSLRKEHHIAHVAEKKYAKQGGVSKKWHHFIGGVIKKWPWVTWGEGGVKNLKKEVTYFVNGPKLVIGLIIIKTLQKIVLNKNYTYYTYY